MRASRCTLPELVMDATISTGRPKQSRDVALAPCFSSSRTHTSALAACKWHELGDFL